jgi:GT2 family glycosyltransferase
MPSVSIIITSFNSREALGPCLTSVQAQKGKADFETIVVDNGSSDGTSEWVSTRFPRVRLVRLDRNLGFAGGNNAGVKAALGRWVVLLNDDTVVEPGWLGELIAPLERGEAALVSSRVYTRGVDPRYYEKNGSISLLGYNIMRVFDDPGTLFSVSGCAAAFSRELFPVPFDGDYFFYSEDVYLSLRARFQGLKVKQAPRSVVRHVGSATTRRISRRVVTFYQERNRLLNLALFFSASVLFRLMPLVFLDGIAKCVLSAASAAVERLGFRNRAKKSPAGVMQAYAWFFTHGSAVAAKRREIQSRKSESDGAVLALMSCKLVNGDSLAARLVNAAAYGYCLVTGIRTVEFKKETGG